jgi:hypothetical protein
VSSTKRREWNEEELLRHIQNYLYERKGHQRGGLDPLSLLEWMVSKGLLFLERAVRRIVEAFVR